MPLETRLQKPASDPGQYHLARQAVEPGPVTTKEARELARRGGELVVLPGAEAC